MKISILCDISACSLVNNNRLFGGTYRPQLQRRRKNQARKEDEASSKGKRNGSHRVKSQKIELFKVCSCSLCDMSLRSVADCGLQFERTDFYSSVNGPHLTRRLHFTHHWFSQNNIMLVTGQLVFLADVSRGGAMLCMSSSQQKAIPSWGEGK
jgi:hypothetical protein